MTSNRYLLTLTASLALLIAGCGKQPNTRGPVAPGAPILKVSVFADGRITADGAATTVDSLRQSLKRLAERKGAVWYYREAGQGEPPPQAMQIMQAIVANRLPVRLSSRPDYTDAIGLDGKPIHQ